MHFRITSSFQRYILIFKWKALHYNSYNNFFSFTFSLYFPFQFLLHYLSVPKQANQERDRQRKCEGERERLERDWIKWEVKKQGSHGLSSSGNPQALALGSSELPWDLLPFPFYTTWKFFKFTFMSTLDKLYSRYRLCCHWKSFQGAYSVCDWGSPGPCKGWPRVAAYTLGLKEVEEFLVNEGCATVLLGRHRCQHYCL